jgi:hypothetical protein
MTKVETMKKSLIALSVLFASIGFSTPNALAANPLTPVELCQRLRITQEILVFDATGGKIIEAFRQDTVPKGLSTGDKSTKKPSDPICINNSMSGESSDSFTGPIHFKHTWKVLSDGSLELSFEQADHFEGRGRDALPGTSLGKKTIVVKDFEPFVWASPAHKAERVIVRLTPSLIDKDAPKDVGKLPLAITDGIAYDGKGRLWSRGITAEGQFVAVTTLQGAVIMSFQDFPGAKKIGRARGSEIRFAMPDGTGVVIKSQSAILPGDMSADVYIWLDLNRKAERIGSQSISAGSKPEEGLKRFNAHQ